MVMHNPGINLIKGDHLGSRDPAHIKRWTAALWEGYRAAPKCTGTTLKGLRCRHPSSPGFDRCCLHHKTVEDKIADELRREQYNLKIARGPNTSELVREALTSLARVGRSRLHAKWKLDPRIEGSTIQFAVEADRLDVIAWLKNEASLDIDKPLPNTGRLLTPRALDRCLWAAWRVIRARGNASEQFITRAHHRVNAAIADDAKFWRRWDEAGSPDAFSCEGVSP